MAHISRESAVTCCIFKSQDLTYPYIGGDPGGRVLKRLCTQ